MWWIMEPKSDKQIVNCSNIKYEVSRKKARVFMICQVHWRRFKFQISRLKFEVQSLTVLDPCWQNRQNKLFKKCPRPFFTILSYIFFFPRKGRNARRAPWGRVSGSRCLNGELFYIKIKNNTWNETFASKYAFRFGVFFRFSFRQTLLEPLITHIKLVFTLESKHRLKTCLMC